MIGVLFNKIFGSTNDRYLKSLKPILTQINKLEPEMQAKPDCWFKERILELKAQIDETIKDKKNRQELHTLDQFLPEVFAIVREASVRTLSMRHFDVQLIGGIVLHAGRIAEMKTGEGKTLVATLTVVLNALLSRGVHVITVNDYLAKRDAEWMGAIYSFLGLSVGVIIHGLDDNQRQEAYNADITYGTNNEFGFDYLRDNMKFYKEQLVQRDHFFSIVDEVDSILIDEARTPLIISGAGEKSTGLYTKINSVVPSLKIQEDFKLDEKARTVTLTEQGVNGCEQLLGIDNLYDPQHIVLQHHILQALKAHYIFKADVDYIVKDNQVVIVDEFTGRLMPGRRFSDGLHQALEAKEKVHIQSENQTLASITFQNYFRMYQKLAGMTGTADTEAIEFSQIYNLRVITIPTHLSMIRKDFPDMVFRTYPEKFEAIVEEIKNLHHKGQPVLVGTISIENSELISARLRKMNIPHKVLNAKHHAEEAAIIADAGGKGKVTIATNMAGRGTDIKIGEEIIELGGLHILGTERHESRRIDNQLRGRSGRQGDPGSSRFYLSLEDDLLRLFGSDRFSGILQKLGMAEGEPIEDKLVSRAIEHAQKRVENHNFEIRKALLDYDNVMNQQREVIYSLRHEIMFEESKDIALEFLEDVLLDIFSPLQESKGKDLEEAKEIALAELQDIFFIQRFHDINNGIPSQEETKQGVLGILNHLEEEAGPVYPSILRYFLLEEIDRSWKEHLVSMDHLREGIGLRGYGQKDPKQEYKKEGFKLFQEMLDRVRQNFFRAICRLKLKKVDENGNPIEEQPKQEEFKHKEEPKNLSYSGSGLSGSKQKVQTVRHQDPKVGRNDPCPCGSGKKYKKCCGI